MVAALECGLHLELHCVNGWPSIRFGKKVIPYNYLLFSQQPLEFLCEILHFYATIQMTTFTH